MRQLAFILISILIGGRAGAQSFNASDFFHVEIGDWWIYQLNGAQSVTIEYTRTELIDGTPTLVGRWTGGPQDGFEVNASFDSAVGTRLWRSFWPSIFVDGIGFVDQLIEYAPPLLTSLPTITIGQVVATQGSLTQTFSNDYGSVVQPGTIDASYRYALIEPISVPFGTFDAIQRQIQLDLTLEVTPGVFNTVRATSRDWLVAGLGSLRIEQTFPDHTDVYVLVNTNRELIPEPSELALSTVAFGALIVLSKLPRRGPE